MIAMSFAHPQWLWLALLAPLAAGAAVWAWRRRLDAAAAWAARGLWDRLLESYRPRRLGLSVACLTLAVLGAAVALAQPRWGRGEEQVERRGVDVVFVLDSSLSMGARDVEPSRLAASRVLIRRLVDELAGHRVGLIQAEGVGEVLAPLTLDGDALDLALAAAEPGSLTDPGTELASALETALELFLEDDVKHRVLVILSDGEDHGGGLEPRLERLADASVTVHALGVATGQGSALPIPGGRPGEVKKDRDGRIVISRLQPETLEQMARATGGVYLQAEDPAMDLTPVLDRIEAMKAPTYEAGAVEVLKDRFQWPLATATLALLLHLAVGPFRGTPRQEGAR